MRILLERAVEEDRRIDVAHREVYLRVQDFVSCLSAYPRYANKACNGRVRQAMRWVIQLSIGKLPRRPEMRCDFDEKVVAVDESADRDRYSGGIRA